MHKLFIRLRMIVPAALVLSIFYTASFAQTQSNADPLADQAALVSEFDVNGLKVIVKRRESAPTVAAGLFFRGGVRNLTEENQGIENFMLNVAVESSKNFPREVVRRELASVGAGIGAGANNDFSVVSLASTLESFDKTWNIFTDLVINPTFDPADINRVRDGILTGLREQETSADGYLQVMQDRIIYANHPYSMEVGGTTETIVKMSAQDLKNYHEKLMETSRMLLVVVGDVDPAELKTRVAATFGKLPRGNYKEIPYPALDFSKSTVDVSQRSLPTNYVRGVFNAPSIGDPDYPAMKVAMAFLQSIVYDEVRVKRQLSYAPNAEIGSLAVNTANIYVTAVEANAAIEVMLKEINSMKTYLVDEERLSGTSGNFLTLYYLDQQTNGAQAAELAKYELIGGGWRNNFRFLERIREVTPEDIRRVSEKYMKNIRFLVVGDPNAVDRSVFLKN
ncbi:MAG: insulinase family protein [Pyrinomonadaceae bacterium]|nr:insulinase family protein [Pyrinomonadaceae bacterium]